MYYTAEKIFFFGGMGVGEGDLLNSLYIKTWGWGGGGRSFKFTLYINKTTFTGEKE